MKKLLSLSVLTLALAACTSVGSSRAPGLGQSTHQMQQAQSERTEVSSENPEGGGASGALAQTRYKTGHTTPLLPASTSSANPTSTSPQR